MKLITIFILASLFFMSTTGHAQGISISEKDVSLEKIFKSIKKQSGYSFVYTQQMLAGTSKVTVHLQNVSVQKVLDECLKGLPLTYSITNNTIVITPKERPKQIQENNRSTTIDVHGRVVNEKGEPVIATIAVKGSKNITSTDDNGIFEIKKIEQNTVLLVSAVNIEETYEINADWGSDLKTINVKSKVSQNEEVSVISDGYRQYKPNEVTGTALAIWGSTYVE